MSPGKKSAISRRFYAFDQLMQKDRGSPLWRDRPMAELQRLTARVWSDQRLALPVPVVRAGRGYQARPGHHRQSWCQFDSGTKLHRIELARNHRSYGILLHELAHAMTAWWAPDHGAAFQRRCLYLYQRYGGLSLDYLLNVKLAAGL